jgi:hypothetical protein
MDLVEEVVDKEALFFYFIISIGLQQQLEKRGGKKHFFFVTK